MEKTAQRALERSFWNKSREKLNIGEAIETLFDPNSEFKKIMDKLRDETDDPVRSILLGENVSSTVKYPDGVSAGEHSAKDLLKMAKKNFGDKEYMMCVHYLDQFH